MYVSKESRSVQCHCDTGLTHVRMRKEQCVSPLSDNAQPVFFPTAASSAVISTYYQLQRLVLQCEA